MASKILLISHKFDPDIGGIEILSEILANSYIESGYEVHLITWSGGPSTKTFSFHVIRNPSLLTIIKEHQWADLVFENNPSLRLSWPALLFKTPTIVVLQTWIARSTGEKSWQDKAKHLWLKRAFKVISCSEAVRKKTWPPSIVIKNPYQEQVFKIQQDNGRPNSFVFLGRLVSDKGADLAISAISKIISNDVFDDISLTIVGNGPERQELENDVLSLKLNEKITFLGALKGESLVTCLNRHKFLIVPSMWEEPFGIVALEGMACGCIPIVSDGGGLPEAIGNAGLTFKRGDVNSLVDCITTILKDVSLQQKMQAEAKIHLQSHYLSVVAEKYLSVIKEALI
jgi:glycosyltransferase involved in cell wall biosynthesis